MRIALKKVEDGCPRIVLHAEMLDNSKKLGMRLDQRNKMILIEIDTPGIQKDIDPKKYKIFICNKIGEEIHSTLKALMKTTGGSGRRTAYGDRKLINNITKLLYDSYNYIKSEEKVLSASSDRSIVACVANKDIISLGGHSKV